MDDGTVGARRAGPGWGSRLLRGLLIFAAGGLLGANVVYYLMTSRTPAGADAHPATGPGGPAPASRAASPPRGVPAAPAVSAALSPDGALAVPVAGVLPAQLVDTFTQSRGGGRVHDAIDILAPAGTPVVAAVDGRVVKLFASASGGITLYQFDAAEQFVYYYAHLQGYAPAIAEGRVLRRGEVLGYVGFTGNADPSAPHLHFAIARLDADKRWHAGTPINPFPLLSGRPAAAVQPAPALPPPAKATAPAASP